jgi:hypothetical protein
LKIFYLENGKSLALLPEAYAPFDPIIDGVLLNFVLYIIEIRVKFYYCDRYYMVCIKKFLKV